MRFYLTLFLTVLFFLATHASVEIHFVSNEEVYINDLQFVAGMRMYDIKDELGLPDKSSISKNKTEVSSYHYDKYGFVFREKDDVVIGFQIKFIGPGSENYERTILFGDSELNAESTVDDVEKHKPLAIQSMSSSWHLSSESNTLSAIANFMDMDGDGKSTVAVVTVTLLKVEGGKKNKKPTPINRED